MKISEVAREIIMSECVRRKVPFDEQDYLDVREYFEPVVRAAVLKGLESAALLCDANGDLYYQEFILKLIEKLKGEIE